MLKTEANKIIDQLEIMFPNARCELHYKTHFELLVAIILSAQTTDLKVNKVTVKNVATEEERELIVDAVFPFIGFDPMTSFLDKELLDENGYIQVDEKLHTKVDGLFAAGDVINKELRQIITAASDGAIAATEAAHYIQSK